MPNNATNRIEPQTTSSTPIRSRLADRLRTLADKLEPKPIWHNYSQFIPYAVNLDTQNGTCQYCGGPTFAGWVHTCTFATGSTQTRCAWCNQPIHGDHHCTITPTHTGTPP